MKSLCFIPLLALVTLTVPAQNIIPLTEAVTLTVMFQNPKAVNNGVTTTISPATSYSITSKSLLEILALDEFREGNYGSSNFPTGAQLVFLADPNSFLESYFVVEDKSGNVLVSVADIMNLQGSGVIDSGAYVNGTGLTTTTAVRSYLATINFNDFAAGGTMQFAIQGYLQANGTSKKVANGKYTETVKSSISNISGIGVFNGNTGLISGSFSATGQVTFAVP